MVTKPGFREPISTYQSDCNGHDNNHYAKVSTCTRYGAPSGKILVMQARDASLSKRNVHDVMMS